MGRSPVCQCPKVRAALVAGLVLGAASAARAQSSGSSDTGGLPAPPSLPPPGGSLLPPFGADPTAPGMTDQLMDVFGLNEPQQASSAAAGPSWQFKPQITVSEEYTDNASASGGPASTIGRSAGSDFITMIQPQLQILNTSDRVRVNISYAPTEQIYAENSSYSQFRQSGTGTTLATLYPDLLYFDLRGSITQQPVYGGFGAVNTETLPPNQQETQSQVSATPYFSHGFGNAGTLQAGAGYIYSATEAPKDLNQAPVAQIGSAGYYGSQWLATDHLFANYTTGQDFGRFQDVLSSDNSFYDGSGALAHAQRVLLTNDASYAVNRFVSALGEIGYENLDYPNAGFSFVGGVWAAGVRLTPSNNSTITLEYRHIDGISAPYAYGSWQVTPRLRVYGGYSEGISSFQQDQQNTLLSGEQNQTGVAASALVAAPVLNNANYFGGNQSLNQVRRLDASAIYTLNRDTFTATFDYQRSTVVGNPAGLSTSLLNIYGLTPEFINYVLLHGIPPFIQGITRTFLQEILSFEHLTTDTSTNLVGGLTWQHDLRPDLTSQIYAGYATSTQAETINVNRPFALVSATLSYDFSNKLTGHATFAGHYLVSGNGGVAGQPTYNQNDSTFTVSLTKSF
jgi:uncharacterized protein (PEP-CTERM system associated)